MRVALDAATPAPTGDDARTNEQRRADGLVALGQLSLRAAELPSRHGVRPHVNVTVSLADLRAWTGIATLGSGETVSLEEIGGLLQDCSVSRTVLGLADAPIAGSVASRTVPAALWRALVERDGGCRWSNCDAPAAWCQVAHGEVPFAADGALSLDNAALLCGHHHRRFDRGGWDIAIDGRHVTFSANPDRPSVVELARQHVRHAPTRAGCQAARAGPDPSRRARPG